MVKLFVPGPVEVERRVLLEMAQPMIHHRSKESVAMIKEINDNLRLLLNTKNDVFLLTSSATGAMEAAMRSCVITSVLCVANGEFGRRWHAIAVANGKSAKLLDFGDGIEIDYARVGDELSRNDFDALAFVINETSTGMENGSRRIKAGVQSAAKDVVILADGVSAVFGTEIDVNDYDVLLFATQKALAIPPGISIVIANSRAIERCRRVEGRGYYFDFLNLKKLSDVNMTLTTPPLPILYALRYRLQQIKKIGIAAYIARHRTLAEFVRGRLAVMGLEPFVGRAYSKTLTVIKNNLGIRVEELIKHLAGKGYVIENGYGPLKNKTFRIGHMGNITLEDTRRLLDELESSLRLFSSGGNPAR